MLKILVLGAALAWGLWWFADLYRGPQMKESVEYVVNEVKGVDTKTTYSNAAQRQYHQTVSTPMTDGNWLGNVRRQKWTAQWWAMGLAPFGLGVLYAFRRV